jgi:hypothetical protein
VGKRAEIAPEIHGKVNSWIRVEVYRINKPRQWHFKKK